MNATAPLPEDQLATLAGELEKHELYAKRGEYPAETTNHPSLKQEIERKTLSELQRLILGLEHGKMSPMQFNAAVESLWMTVAGLVPKEVMNLISDTKAQLIDAEQYVSAAYANPDNTVVMVMKWQPGASMVKVVKCGTGQHTESVLDAPDGLIPSMDSKLKFRKLCEQVEKKGWRKL